jgi:hypothetical protein
MARLDDDIRGVTYRYYVTEAIFATGIMNARYVDIVNGKWKPQDKRSGDEIAADVIAKAGLILKE